MSGDLLNMENIILKTENICKSFSTVEVLHSVSFTIRYGEILGIIGGIGSGISLNSISFSPFPYLTKAFISSFYSICKIANPAYFLLVSRFIS